MLALFCALLGTPAEARPLPSLTAAEFRHDPSTLDRGTVLIHPLFLPSSWAITDGIQLNSTLVAWRTGPNLSAEFRLADFASLEPEFRFAWEQDWAQSTLMAHFGGPVGRHRLNANLGLSVTALPSEVLWVTLPVNLNFQLVVSNSTRWRFELANYGVNYDSVGFGTFTVTWNHAVGRVLRLALGATVWAGNNPGPDALAEFRMRLPVVMSRETTVLPCVELWLRL
ncbi:MAG: hypothetical protein EP330_28790 [Deltaproteobacteria bacterium]|nr:MAG: hypothetical protein EP330_28790 [Deltaproteobacteria bacterium]